VPRFIEREGRAQSDRQEGERRRERRKKKKKKKTSPKQFSYIASNKIKIECRVAWYSPTQSKTVPEKLPPSVGHWKNGWVWLQGGHKKT
jgi:hypothetical protein